MAYLFSILNCRGGKNCIGADPRFSCWQLQVSPSTDPRRCHVCPSCCLSSILGGRERFLCVCAGGVYAPVPVCAGQVLATRRSVQTQLGHLDRRTAGDCKWQQDEWALFCQVLASFIQEVQLWTGSVVTVRWCNGWLVSVGRATAASIWSLQRGSVVCLGKEAKLKEP